jgi:AraC-like DNA-binding protein
MDNYYSDDEAGRLHWVAVSFFASLAVGVTALLSVMSMSTLVVLIFSVVSDIFYTFFAVRLINYAHHFQFIERAMDDGAPDSDSKFISSDAFILLEKRIEEWIADKGFTQQGITIDLLSVRLATNRSYLSRYANTCKKQTFREWINALRIEESQRLLQQYPEMPLTEIASQVGFSDKSNFIRRFIRHANVSPGVWREKHL